MERSCWACILFLDLIIQHFVLWTLSNQLSIDFLLLKIQYAKLKNILSDRFSVFVSLLIFDDITIFSFHRNNINRFQMVPWAFLVDFLLLFIQSFAIAPKIRKILPLKIIIQNYLYTLHRDEFPFDLDIRAIGKFNPTFFRFFLRLLLFQYKWCQLMQENHS